MWETCPACRHSALKKSDLTTTIPEVLTQWERVLQSPVPIEVWDDYRDLERLPIALFECPNCGFGRFEPTVAGTPAFYTWISAANYYNDDKWEFAQAADELLAASARRILDVGCGSGQFLDYLRGRLPDVDLFGFDINVELLQQLRGRGFGVITPEVTHADTTLLEHSRFDAITMLQVLEHTDDPLVFLDDFSRLLKPGGLMIVATPDAAGPIRTFPGALTELPPHHLTRWTAHAFRTLLPTKRLRIRAVRFEPLPDYLWDAYLPEIWDEDIWPYRIFDPIARRRGMETTVEKAGLAAQAMRSAGIRWLHGVPGHTIFVVATKEDEN